MTTVIEVENLEAFTELLYTMEMYGNRPICKLYNLHIYSGYPSVTLYAVWPYLVCRVWVKLLEGGSERVRFGESFHIPELIIEKLRTPFEKALYDWYHWVIPSMPDWNQEARERYEETTRQNEETEKRIREELEARGYLPGRVEVERDAY